MVELLSEAKGGAATAQPGSVRRVVASRGLVAEVSTGDPIFSVASTSPRSGYWQ